MPKIIPPESPYYNQLIKQWKASSNVITIEKSIADFFISLHIYSQSYHAQHPEAQQLWTPENGLLADHFLANALYEGNRDFIGFICSYFNTAAIEFDDDFYGKNTALLYALEQEKNDAVIGLVTWAATRPSSIETRQALLNLLAGSNDLSYFQKIQRYACAYLFANNPETALIAGALTTAIELIAPTVQVYLTDQMPELTEKNKEKIKKSSSLDMCVDDNFTPLSMPAVEFQAKRKKCLNPDKHTDYGFIPLSENLEEEIPTDGFHRRSFLVDSAIHRSSVSSEAVMQSPASLCFSSLTEGPKSPVNVASWAYYSLEEDADISSFMNKFN